MAYVRLGLQLAERGREDRASALLDELLERARTQPGFRSGQRVHGRVGHGPRWLGWISTWDDRETPQAAAEAASELVEELRGLAEPRTCQELVLEAGDVEPLALAEQLAGARAER
ncbi:MAG: hypothetical protein FJZ92_01975 [Chloroflexi bacterium]|nr:hypothetical protein [Chloroflexota bacterium]